MAVSRVFGRTSTTVDTFSWTAIVAPISGGRVVLQPDPAGGQVKFRTNDGVASTEFTLNAGIQKTYDLAGEPRLGFTAGEIVCWAQAVTGTGPVLADWS